jgi:uncharacterized coiled-coil DUF342 family protein
MGGDMPTQALLRKLKENLKIKRRLKSWSSLSINNHIFFLYNLIIKLFKIKNVGFDELSQRLDELSQRLDELSQRLDELSQRLDELSQRLDELSQRLDEPSQWLDEPSQWLDELSQRLDELSRRFSIREVQIEYEE